MSAEDIVFTGDGPDVERAFEARGVVHLKGFFDHDPIFNAYVDDLARLGRMLLGGVPAGGGLDTVLSAFQRGDSQRAVPLYHLGTQPMQVLSGGLLKLHPRLVSVLRRLLGDGAVLGTTAASDNLLAVPPGQTFDRYVLPRHQDLPYQLQSPSQLTAWIALSERADGAGGLELWPGSHRLGLLDAAPNPNGHLESRVPCDFDRRFPPAEIDWNRGDLVLMHGLLVHRGLPNRSRDRVRLVQLFRFTDLAAPAARDLGWRSKHYARSGAEFGEARELLAAGAGRA